MATYNQMQVQQKPKFSVAITTKGYQSLISNTLRDPARARRFTASITSAVAVNPALQECDAGTILAGALLGESLNLSPSPQLGQYYLVPFKQKAKYDRSGRMIRPESVTATFVLGYKGYIQLALRSGQYRELDVMEIKEGEYLGKDSTTGKAKFQFIEDDDQRDALPTVGYGRSVVTYADNLAEWADAAWVGSVGPFWPESVTWKWKVPDGVSVADLRDSERDLLEENRVNFMTAEYKHEYMKNGICGDGNFIDNVLGADYITHQIRENLYEIFIANKKIAYTDDGFALVAAGVFAALNRAVELHIIATDPEDDTGVYTVVIPKRADATDEQARNRQMPDIKWSAQLEGAVHSVKVNGTLRVTLNG